MAKSVKTVSLTDLSQQVLACFDAAMSGDLVRVVSGNQEAYLISAELFQFITDCMLNYEMLITTIK